MNEQNRDKAKVVKRLKEGFAGVPASRVLSEELIAERREDTWREEAELEAGPITRRLRGSIER